MINNKTKQLDKGLAIMIEDDEEWPDESDLGLEEF